MLETNHQITCTSATRKATKTKVNQAIDDIEDTIYELLMSKLERCTECGWSGVVFEYEPAFGDTFASFGLNEGRYCPECGDVGLTTPFEETYEEYEE